MAWRIERISPTSSVLCSGHSANGLKCDAKIAKYRRPVAAPTFNGIQRLRKSRETEQMQFWFCPGKFQACIKDLRSRSIVHFPALPLVWPIMSGTNLTQAEVAEFEASGYSFSTSETNLSSVHPGLPLEESLPSNDPISLSAPVGIELVVPIPVCSQIVSDGDKRPKHRSGKLFCFVPLPSSDHLLKMESSKVIDCTVLKSMLVPGTRLWSGIYPTYPWIDFEGVVQSDCVQLSGLYLQRFSIHVHFSSWKSYKEMDSL